MSKKKKRKKKKTLSAQQNRCATHHRDSDIYFNTYTYTAINLTYTRVEYNTKSQLLKLRALLTPPEKRRRNTTANRDTHLVLQFGSLLWSSVVSEADLVGL